MEMKGSDAKNWFIIMCKLNGRMDNESHYYVEMKGKMEKGGIMICKL